MYINVIAINIYMYFDINPLGSILSIAVIHASSFSHVDGSLSNIVQESSE